MKYWTKKKPTTAGWYWVKYKIDNEIRVRPAMLLYVKGRRMLEIAEGPAGTILTVNLSFGARIQEPPPNPQLSRLITKINKYYLMDIQRGRDGSWHWSGRLGLQMMAMIAKFLNKNGFEVIGDKLGHKAPIQYSLGKYSMFLEFERQLNFTIGIIRSNPMLLKPKLKLISSIPNVTIIDITIDDDFLSNMSMIK